MQDYAKLFRRKSEEQIATKKIRQIKRLLKMKIPISLQILMIVSIVYPMQMIHIIRK